MFRAFYTLPVTVPLFGVGLALRLTEPVAKIGLLGVVPAIGYAMMEKSVQIAKGE